MPVTRSKFFKEFNRLQIKTARIVALLNLLDADIKVRRDIERDNDVPFAMRKSIEVEETREKWQKHLVETRKDILLSFYLVVKDVADKTKPGTIEELLSTIKQAIEDADINGTY